MLCVLPWLEENVGVPCLTLGGSFGLFYLCKYSHPVLLCFSKIPKFKKPGKFALRSFLKSISRPTMFLLNVDCKHEIECMGTIGQTIIYSSFDPYSVDL